MTPSKLPREYVLNRVHSASPVELIRILYETALQAVDEARTALEAGDILARGQAVTRALEIFSELRFALRRDVHPQYCDTLAGLYSYMQERLIRAHSEKSTGPLEEVSRLLRTLLEGWTGAMNNLSARPVQEWTAPEEEQMPALSGSNPYSKGPAGETARGRSWQL